MVNLVKIDQYRSTVDTVITVPASTSTSVHINGSYLQVTCSKMQHTHDRSATHNQLRRRAMDIASLKILLI